MRLKKSARSSFSASSTDLKPTQLNPASSGQIGGRTDAAISAIGVTLAALKEASTLAGKIPFIAPVAGLLLQAITMRDEVKQHKEEWDVVMDKLERIGGLVGQVDSSCKEHNLEEKDVPRSLRAIFESLAIELDVIKRALKENNEVGRLKKLFLRKDLLRKVKQHDAKLSNVLNYFQAQLQVDVRFAQLAEGRRVSTADIVTDSGPTGPSVPSDVAISMPRGPRSPHVFGRDAELAQIIHMIFTNLGSHPAHIAILGPGGYGKSTLANAVLTQERVREHFGDARYFVACESIFSSGALLIELAKTLGVFDGATGALWSRICNALNSKDCILCFDNFESPWDQDGPDGDIRSSIEEVLSRVAETRHTTLLITMRGTVRPAQTQWTLPHLLPLVTLSCDAARSIWEHIANNYDESAEELIKAVDFVPLAVSLLAYLAQATSAEILLKLWNSKQTGFIHIGHANRQTNLEFSIQLSINSSRMKANPSANELLGVLCMLPDGMHIKQVENFITVLHEIDILSGICTLQECGMIRVIGERYQTHPIIRNFCNNYILISQENKSALRDFYIKLASTKYDEANTSNYAKLVLEVNNTKAMLSDLLKSDFQNHAKLVSAICEFMRFQRASGDFSEKLIDQLVKFLQQKSASTLLVIQCLTEWGKLHFYLGNLEIAIVKLKEAEMLCKASKKEKSVYYATVLYWLAAVYRRHNAFNNAEVLLQKALEINKLNNNVSGQAESYRGLGQTYKQLDKLDKAEASFQKAIELYKHFNNSIGQGDSYRGLGDIYLGLNRLNEAEASFQGAIKFAKLGHSSLLQGSALRGLGKVKMLRSQMQDAKLLFEDALAMHKQAQDLSEQKWDQHYLNDVSSKMSQSSNLSVD